MGKHFKSLPSVGSTVTLLDRKGDSTREALVVGRVKRNGKLRLAFVGKTKTKSHGKTKFVTKVMYTIAVPNASDWAKDKTVRFRWSFNNLTRPRFPETTDAGQIKKAPKSARKTATPEAASLPTVAQPATTQPSVPSVN